MSSRFLACTLVAVVTSPCLDAQNTRLLRQPTMSETEIAFSYGGDIWVVARSGGEARRLTSTPAIESFPHFSPDGRWIAFSSNRSGVNQVYVVSREGGDPTRLTWHPSTSFARGWSPDGESVLYASMRDAAPSFYHRLVDGARDRRTLDNAACTMGIRRCVLARWPAADRRPHVPVGL